MLRTALVMLGAFAAGWTGYATAHHSFAIYDMDHEVEFKGVVATVKFRNPHMAMTLTVPSESGGAQTINFVEGAPANMLARLGLTPVLIEPGTAVTAIGAPRRDDPNAWFLKAIILPNGQRFNALQSPRQER